MTGILAARFLLSLFFLVVAAMLAVVPFIMGELGFSGSLTFQLRSLLWLVSYETFIIAFTVSALMEVWAR